MLAGGPGSKEHVDAWFRRQSDRLAAHWVLDSLSWVPLTLFYWVVFTDRGLIKGTTVALGVWLVVLPFAKWRHERVDSHQPSKRRSLSALIPAFVMTGALVAAAADAPLITALVVGALAGLLYLGLLVLVLRQLPSPDDSNPN